MPYFYSSVVVVSAEGVSLALGSVSAWGAAGSLAASVARAKQLEFQINALSEQYDGLRIELSRAQADAQIASRAAAIRPSCS